MMEHHLQCNDTSKKSTIGCVPYAMGIVSFAPLVGLPFGVVAVLWGIWKWRQGGPKLVLLGGMGLLVTFLLYGFLFHQIAIREKGGIFQPLLRDTVQSALATLVREIEIYKVQYGEYPSTLDQLQLSGPITIYDPSTIGWRGHREPKLFYYERTTNGVNYYLFSLGSDGIPFTDDDILLRSEDVDSAFGYLPP